MLTVLASARVNLQQWREAQQKASSQLRSMSNLVEQLAALRRCREGANLGCLAWYPQLGRLLEASILASFERALGYVHKHRCVCVCMKASLVRLCLGFSRGFSCSETLAGVCKQLKCHWKECERLLSDIIGMGHVMRRTELTGVQGSEVALLCTADSFSLGDITEWLKLLNAAHVYDMKEKQAVLGSLSCTPDSLEQVCSIWSREPTEELTGEFTCDILLLCGMFQCALSCTEILEFMQYTVEHFKKRDTG